jgi:adenylate kinase
MKTQHKRCFFVGGVHGVGKSTLSASVAKELSLGCYVASSLIKKVSDDDAELFKEVKNVSKNQDILLQALARFVPDQDYVLDGHFVIRSTTLGIVPVPTETFASIPIMEAVIFTGLPEEMAARIYERDGKIITSGVLAEMQQAELEHGKVVAQVLGIRLTILANPAREEFLQVLKNAFCN